MNLPVVKCIIINNGLFISWLDEDLPLPEDTELRCFQYIEKAHRYGFNSVCYNVALLVANMLYFELLKNAQYFFYFY